MRPSPQPDVVQDVDIANYAFTSNPGKGKINRNSVFLAGAPNVHDIFARHLNFLDTFFKYASMMIVLDPGEGWGRLYLLYS